MQLFLSDFPMSCRQTPTQPTVTEHTFMKSPVHGEEELNLVGNFIERWTMVYQTELMINCLNSLHYDCKRATTQTRETKERQAS